MYLMGSWKTLSPVKVVTSQKFVIYFSSANVHDLIRLVIVENSYATVHKLLRILV